MNWNHLGIIYSDKSEKFLNEKLYFEKNFYKPLHDIVTNFTFRDFNTCPWTEGPIKFLTIFRLPTSMRPFNQIW